MPTRVPSEVQPTEVPPSLALPGVPARRVPAEVATSAPVLPLCNFDEVQ